MKLLRRIGRIFVITAILLLSLMLSVMILIQIPAVQTQAVRFATDKLNESFDTQIGVERVELGFFGRLRLMGVTAIDKHDTKFIDIERFDARLSLTQFLRDPNNIQIRSITLTNPEVKSIIYKGDSISNFIRLIDKFGDPENDEPSKFKLDGNLTVHNGKLLLHNENLEGYEQDWVNAENLNLKIENFKLDGDEIWADLKTFSFDGKRNGENYRLENFAGKFHLSDTEISFEDWKFQTEDTQIEGHIALLFDSHSDMADFTNKVRWDMELKEGSKVGFKDIRYFAKDFDNDHIVNIQGNVDGVLNKMNFNAMQLSGGGVFLASDHFHISDMTEGNQIAIGSDEVKLKTSYKEATAFLPTFISETIPDFADRFGSLDYRGTFHLNPSHIDMSGYALTSLGDATVDVVLSDYQNDLSYKGSVVTQNFNLRQIAETSEIGFVKGHMEFDGRGLDIKDMNIKANGNLAYLDLLGKRYQNISINGRLNREIFTGFASIRDPNLNVTYDGEFDFAQQPFKVNFTSEINHLNLDYLGVTEKMNAFVKADAKGDFSFEDIDSFLGELELQNLYFTSKNDTLDLDYAYFISSKSENEKHLEVDIPGYMDGAINGQFRLSQLPGALMNTVGTTLRVNYEIREVDADQNFNFHFEVERDLFSKIDPDIRIAPGTIVDGVVDTGTNTLIAELSSSEIGYGGIYAFGPLINIDTSKEEDQIFIRTDSLEIQKLTLYNAHFHTTPIEDTLLMKTGFQMGKDFPVNFNLNLYNTLDEEKNIILGFSSSDIDVDGTDWLINPENKTNSNRTIINLSKNQFVLQDLKIESGEQHLHVDGYYNNRLDFQLQAELEKLNLEQIIPQEFLGELKLEGIANGELDIIRSETKFEPLMHLNIDEIYLNNYSLGDLGLNGVYNAEEKIFDVEIMLDQGQVQVLYANGFIDNKPDTPELDFVASLDDLEFKFLESFLEAAMSNLRGKMSGDLRFAGPIDSPHFDGMLDLADLGFKVDYLNVDYSFDGINSVPVSKESGGQGFIALDGLNFRDTTFNTRGTVSGQLLFRDIASWFLNLSFNTPNLLVMNTKPVHNDLFYGKIFGQGAFELFGPPEKLDISANAIVNEGSELTINTGATKVEGQSTLVRFIPEPDKDPDDDGTPKGMDIDLTITAHPNTTINLIFDPASGDMVTASGSAEDLRFHMFRTGNINMNGTYTLESGLYKLRQVALLKRDFEIKPGSFITWNDGDPFDAIMDITAYYEKTVSNVGEYLGAGYSKAYDVVLGIDITEALNNPKMNFTINIPKGSTEVQSLLNYKFNLDPDEKMIQFGSIILFGRFVVDSSSSGSLLAAGATSTGAAFALRQLGGVLNSLIAGTGITIGVDWVQGSGLSNTSDMFKGDVSVNLSPRWTFNGEVGVPMGDSYTNETTTGEAEIEWDISRRMNKSLVLNFFTRPANFGVQNFGGAGNFQSFGGGITFMTSFDRFSEIFKRRETLEDRMEKQRTEESDYFPETPPEHKEVSDSLEGFPEVFRALPDDTSESVADNKIKSAKKERKNGLVRFK